MTSPTGGVRRVFVLLFRQDLRVHDQPLFQAAFKAASHLTKEDKGQQVHLCPLYCFDPRQIDLSALPGSFPEAKTWHFGFKRTLPQKATFQIESVLDLQLSLRETWQTDLLVRFGEPERVIQSLKEHLLAQEPNTELRVFCQKEQTYEEVHVEKAIAAICPLTLTDGGTTMVHPHDTPFEAASCPKIFTSFRKAVEGLRDKMVRPVFELQASSGVFGRYAFPKEAVADFMPEQKDYLPALQKAHQYTPDSRTTIPYKGGESSALARLKHYCRPDGPLMTYKQTRNAMMGLDGSSHFSPFLAFGCLSARQLYWAVKEAEAKHPSGGNQDSYWLIFELLWRDYWKFLARSMDDSSAFFHLYGLDSAKSEKRWNQTRLTFEAWRDGQTGVPLVDANMRELKATGYCSNRGRQNVADFLAGQLHMDWRLGAEWFEAVLVDHDVCSNYGNWLYVAGVGTDPRARSFNMVKQSMDYDADGDYIRQWIPELKEVSAPAIHQPWICSTPPKGYPKPLIMRPEWKRQGHRQKGEGSKMHGNKRERVEAKRFH